MAVGSFAARMIARHEPWLGQPSGVALETNPELPTGPLLETTSSLPVTDLTRLLRALAVMFEPTTLLAEEEGEDGVAGYVPAWGTLLNVNTCPGKDLPYLGQFVGVEVSKGASEAEARAEVKREAGLARGTLASIEEACKKVLGSSPFTIEERTAEGGSEAAYHFNVLVGIGKSTKALREAIEFVVPGGLFFSVLEVSGAWISGTKKWSEVAAGLKWTEAVEGTY